LGSKKGNKKVIALNEMHQSRSKVTVKTYTALLQKINTVLFNVLFIK